MVRVLGITAGCQFLAENSDTTGIPFVAPLTDLHCCVDTHLVDKSNKSAAFLGLFQSVWPDPDKSATVPTIVGILLTAAGFTGPLPAPAS